MTKMPSTLARISNSRWSTSRASRVSSTMPTDWLPRRAGSATETSSRPSEVRRI